MQQVRCDGRNDAEPQPTGSFAFEFRDRFADMIVSPEVSRISASTTSPASVGMTGFLLRSSSTTPNSSSKDLICMLNDGWVTKQCSAAKEKLPQLATASRYSSWMIVIVYLICTHENIKNRYFAIIIRPSV